MKPKTAVTTTDIVDQIIDLAISNGASDIHFEPFADKLRIRFRQDGVLYVLQDLPTSYIPEITRRIKIMAEADIADARRHQGGRLLYQHKSGEIDIRFSTYVTVHGEKIVLRLMGARGRKVINIQDIGIPPRSFIRFREYGLKRPSGVIIFTGPTGSGKTNSVYSCIDYLNKPDVSILTAEEPVESIIDGICQCSINPKINLTFEETLRHVVRQDPDIVVIGEIKKGLFFFEEKGRKFSLKKKKI